MNLYKRKESLKSLDERLDVNYTCCFILIMTLEFGESRYPLDVYSKQQLNFLTFCVLIRAEMKSLIIC